MWFRRMWHGAPCSFRTCQTLAILHVPRPPRQPGDVVMGPINKVAFMLCSLQYCLDVHSKVRGRCIDRMAKAESTHLFIL